MMQSLSFNGIDLSDIPESEIKQTLPESLAELTEVCTLAAILSLVECFGGTRAFIPQQRIEGSTLAEAIGLENAAAIAKGFADAKGMVYSEAIYIPRCQNTFIALRNKKMRLMRGYGATVNELARRFFLSDKQVENILRKA